MRGRSRLFQQPRQRGDALRHQRRVRRDAVVGQAVPGGEAQHLGLRREEGQRLGQPRHAGIVAGDMQDGAGELAAAAGQQEGVPPLRRAEDRSDGHRRCPRSGKSQGLQRPGCAAASASPPRAGSACGRSASPPARCPAAPAPPPAPQAPTRAARRCAAARSRRAGCRSRTSRDGWRDTADGGASNRGRLVLVHSSARCHIAAR